MKTIETIDEDGNKIKLDIIKPNNKTQKEAQRQYNLKIAQLLKRSVETNETLLTRSQLDEYLSKIGVWTEEHEKKFLSIQLEIRSCELILRKGGIKLSEARAVAIRAKSMRAQLMNMYMKRNEFDASTIESMAEEHKMHYLISECVLKHNSQLKYFNGINDYINKSDQKASIDCAIEISAMLYGYNKNFDNELIENKWLVENGFMNKDGQLIQNGKSIDVAGNKIDKNGKLIDENGDFVDIHGNKVDKNGNFIIDTKPFLDDNNKPIVKNNIKKTNSRKKRKIKKTKVKNKVVIGGE